MLQPSLVLVGCSSVKCNMRSGAQRHKQAAAAVHAFWPWTTGFDKVHAGKSHHALFATKWCGAFLCPSPYSPMPSTRSFAGVEPPPLNLDACSQSKPRLTPSSAGSLQVLPWLGPAILAWRLTGIMAHESGNYTGKLYGGQFVITVLGRWDQWRTAALSPIRVGPPAHVSHFRCFLS